MAEWRDEIARRLAPLGLDPSREAEIAEELAQHLEDRWRELVARGATPEDAAHTARTEFDGARLEALLATLRQAHWHEAGESCFGLDPRDARAYGVAMATLIAVSLVATVLPARRAASIDPTEALRSE